MHIWETRNGNHNQGSSLGCRNRTGKVINLKEENMANMLGLGNVKLKFDCF